MPLAVDLYCGVGAASFGYFLAGFDMIGVDIEPQPDYPFKFYQADALYFPLTGADVVVASPPCQAHTPVSAYANKWRRRHNPDLIPQTRDRLQSSGLPWVMENVPAARLRRDAVLCGTHFGLMVFRHRVFESSLPIHGPGPCKHDGLAMRNGYLPTDERPYMTITGRNGHHSKAWQRKAAEVMRCPWITTLNGICEAIPPDYTHYIGKQIMAQLR